jgi:site-specific DNA-cytosine methylase
MDALEFSLDGFDAIHASPPCPVHSSLNGWSGDSKEPDLIPQTRAQTDRVGAALRDRERPRRPR